ESDRPASRNCLGVAAQVGSAGRDRRRRARRLDNTGARRATATPTRSEDPSRGARDSKKSRSLLRQGDRPDPAAVVRSVEREKAGLPMATRGRPVGVSASGYAAWRQRVPPRRHNEDATLKEHGTRIHGGGGGARGAPRIHAELRAVHKIRGGMV